MDFVDFPGSSIVFPSFWLVWIVVAGLLGFQGYCFWLTARRWNALLRRSGRAADDEVFEHKNRKLLGFILSEKHRAFGDPRLSTLVRRSRWASAGTIVGALVFWAWIAITVFPTPG